MGLFRKKTVQERINKKWGTQTCSLSQLKTLLLKEDLIEFWIRHGDTYFQLGTSSDSDRRGFFDKVYYINCNTARSLYQLLNHLLTDDGFFMSEDIELLFQSELVGGKPLSLLWDHCVIVGVDEQDPVRYLSKVL